MLYMVGDNNLSDEMIGALSRVRSGQEVSDDIAIFAQFDGPHPSIKTKRMNLQLKGTGRNYKVEISNDDTASEQAIYDFAKVCINGDPKEPTIFPGGRADKYALILSGHGDGVQQRTLLLDESPDRVLTIPGLKSAISRIYNDFLGRKLAILGVDSCLMNSLELSFELRGFVKLLVASQGNIPNAGWDLAAICKQLSSLTTNTSPAYVARHVLTDTLLESNRPFACEGGRSTDLSVCNLDHFADAPKGGIVSALEEFAGRLRDHFPAIGNEPLRRASNGKLHNSKLTEIIIADAVLISRMKCQKFLSNQAIDLFDFCYVLRGQLKVVRQSLELAGGKGANQLKADLTDISESCQRIMDSIKGPKDSAPSYRLIQYGIYSGSDAQFANGVSLFFPWTGTAYGLLKGSYENLALSVDPAGRAWIDFIERFLFFVMRDREFRERSSPPYYKSSPPYYKGSDIYLDYFGRISNFIFNADDEGRTDEHYRQ